MNVFSKDNWSDSDELNKFIPVSAALSFEKVESSLEDAIRLFVLPLFGERLTEQMVSYYTGADTTDLQKELLAECQRAVANLAFWYNYTELNIRITDQGMQRQESEGTFKQTYKYQEDLLRQGFKNKGFNALDRMIEFLDKHTDAFPEYKDSPAYAYRRNAIVRSTAEVDGCCFINNSHLIFLRMKPLLKVVEETRLQPLLGTTLYLLLQESLKKEESKLGETTVEELRSRCAKFVIFATVADLVRSTGSLTDRGLYFTQFLPGDGNTSVSPADKEEALAMAADMERKAQDYSAQLLRFVENKLPEYFKGRQSQVLNRDNNHKRTVWL